MRREEIVVVGGGIAGTFAALAARDAGASVTLIEEQSAVGGYLRWTLSQQDGLDGGWAGFRGFELAQRAWEQLYDAGVNVQLNSTAWGLFEDQVLGVVNPESSYRLKADRIILATGSTDIAIPFTGWDLAGVMTGRAALIAMNLHRVLPGSRVGLVGNGADVDEVRASLELAGASIALHANDVSSAEAGGDGSVAWLANGTDRSEVDAVFTVHGIQPDPELALHIGAETRYSALSGVRVPARDEQLKTGLPGLYVVGDAAGVCTTAEAAREGTVAGIAAADSKDLDRALDDLAGVRSSSRADEIRSMMPGATS